jgi:hypothetical protein
MVFFDVRKQLSSLFVKYCGGLLEAMAKPKVLGTKDYPSELCFPAAEEHDTALDFDINAKGLIHIFGDKAE